MQDHSNRLKITNWVLYGSVAAVVLFMVVTIATLNTVKVNGPIYQSIVSNKDLTADILPPPAYLVEHGSKPASSMRRCTGAIGSRFSPDSGRN
jgi:hypothetical protein